MNEDHKTLQDGEPVRRRADGSIDMGYYDNRARRLRSAAFHRAFGRLRARIGAARARSVTGATKHLIALPDR